MEIVLEQTETFTESNDSSKFRGEEVSLYLIPLQLIHQQHNSWTPKLRIFQKEEA